MYYSEVLSERGAEYVHNVYVCHKYCGTAGYALCSGQNEVSESDPTCQ